VASEVEPIASTEDPALVAELAAATTIELAEPGSDEPTVQAAADPLVLTPEPEWVDLAGHRPGAQARTQAIAHREAAPVRTLLARVLGVKTNERAWGIGADGEEAVGARLSRLGDEWHVLHAVPVGENGSDIDHVVIGPAGVFTVNAKNHPGARIWVGGNTFMVNGQKVPYVRNSRHEANRAAKLLTLAAGFPVEASGVIAVIGAQGGFTIREQPTDGRVVVVTRKKIANYLSARPVTLRPEQIEAIHQAARRSTTWRAASPARNSP
jgi:hypothetical protein